MPSLSCLVPSALLLLNFWILLLFGPPECLLSSNHGRRDFRFLGLGKGTSMFYTPDIEKYSCTWIALCFYTQTPALTPKNHSATLPQLSSYERVWLLSQCDPAMTRQHPEHKRQFSWWSGWWFVLTKDFFWKPNVKEAKNCLRKWSRVLFWQQTFESYLWRWSGHKLPREVVNSLFWQKITSF